MLLSQAYEQAIPFITLNELEEVLRMMRKKHHRCPECGSDDIFKNGYTGLKRKARFRCKKCERTFVE